jgi:hypothetical protein
MSTDRILQRLDRLYCLVEQHNSLLTDLATSLPQHENTISALRQQFEAHISFLLVNLESYTTLQQSITSTIRQHPAHFIVTAYPVPPPRLQFLRNPHQPPGDTRAQGNVHTTPYVQVERQASSPTGLIASNRQRVSPTTFEASNPETKQAQNYLNL